MLPFKLQKQMQGTTPLYTYREVVELVAFALIDRNSREDGPIESFKDKYPDVFDQKCIEADRMISIS